MPTINMQSSANLVKGQGVASAYNEQVKLVTDGLKGKFEIFINSNKKCDIIHYHTINPHYYVHASIHKKRSANVGSVHFLPETVNNSLQLPKPAKTILYKYIIDFYDSMDYLVTVNPCFIAELEKYGIPRKRIAYIPNYVSEDDFYPMERYQINATRTKLGIDSGRFTVLGVGQVQLRKGVLDFIEVARRMPSVCFIWAGGFSFGAMTDGYKELKEVMENPPENVIFTGIIDREDMNAIYNAADVMFLPSFAELFPMTILESMCCRKPILLRDLDIYPDILFDYYLKADDVAGFEHQLTALNSNAAFYNHWAEKSWEGHLFYSKSSVLKKWAEFYQSVYEECTLARHEQKSISI